MFRLVFCLCVSVMVSGFLASPLLALSLPIENGSFESPAIDLSLNPFGAWPAIDGWTETDLDTLGSQNTGVFVNSPMDSNDHVVNADGAQLAFLGSEAGNGLSQELGSVYQAGASYRLTVGVAVSSRFPPAMGEGADEIELALYYMDGNEPADIVTAPVVATGLSSTELELFSLELPAVSVDAAWAGQTIGVAIRAAGQAGGFWDLDDVHVTESWPVALRVENGSFESPAIDLSLNPFGAWPMIDDWLEMDLDTLGSQNTGVFVNSPADTNDHLANAAGVQLAFLGSEAGNGLSQGLTDAFQAGAAYRLTVGVGVSSRFPPAMGEDADTLELALYYFDGNEPTDIVTAPVAATGLSSTELQDFSLELGPVDANAAWAGQAIGVAIRATGQAGGFWDLDDVRVTESWPLALALENGSFESPAIDLSLNPFGAWPMIDGWLEMDLDTLGSQNTGVFVNSPADSNDHLAHADGAQLAFLGSEAGNGLSQELGSVYQTGAAYRLMVGVGVSSRFPPAMGEGADSLELAFYYLGADGPRDITSAAITATGLSSTELKTFSLVLPAIASDSPWAGQAIGVAIRATGQAGGFWDLDNVQVLGSMGQ